MTRICTFVGLIVPLLLVAGCAKSDTSPQASPPGNANAPASQASEPENSSIQPDASQEEVSELAQDIAIGLPGPAWENLTGIDDQQHSLKDLSAANAVAVVFTCNHCPVAEAYEDRLVQLAKDYKDKGVELVAINVNNLEADKLPAMKERAAAKGFDFQYLYDPSQEIGRAYSATVTPHVFLLDKDRKVVYMGAIDDNQDTAAVTKHHLRDAIDAVLAGQTPATATTQQFGCSIQYD
ncbi:MAG: thioredoxin family protein [Planctomycetes bacterium]|nr:thioredoxin family protein [Planctomycetota bacterium]